MLVGVLAGLAVQPCVVGSLSAASLSATCCASCSHSSEAPAGSAGASASAGASYSVVSARRGFTALGIGILGTKPVHAAAIERSKTVVRILLLLFSVNTRRFPLKASQTTCYSQIGSTHNLLAGCDAIRQHTQQVLRFAQARVSRAVWSRRGCQKRLNLCRHVV